MRIITLVLVVLVIATVLPGQDDAPARQVFERAAFAEEHERDFAKAEKLYREAGSKAAFLGDQALADEAMKAIKRLEARTGKAAETQPVPNAVQRRLYLLIRQLSAPVTGEGTPQTTIQTNYEAMNQIVPFGAAAVPMLEKAMNAEVIVDPELAASGIPRGVPLLGGGGATAGPDSEFRGDSKWGARTLAMIKGPEAMAALRRGLKSPDPVVRSAVITSAHGETHRKILEEALEDPASEVVALAISRLSQLDDPALESVMKRAIGRDDHAAEAAAGWLLGRKPQEAIAMMKDVGGSGTRAVEALARQYWRTIPLPPVQKFEALVDIAEAAPTSEQAARILVVPSREDYRRDTVPWGALSQDVRRRASAVALRALEDPANDPIEALSVLAYVGDVRAAEAFVRLVEAGRYRNDNDRTWVFREVAGRAAPEDLPRLAELGGRLAALVPNDADNIVGSLTSLAKRADPRDVVAALNALPEAHRQRLVKAAVHFDRVPLEIARAALDIDAQVRVMGLKKLAKIADPATLPDAVRAITSPVNNVQLAGGELFAAIARKDPVAAFAELERQLEVIDIPDHMQHLLPALNVLPRADVAAALEKSWKPASADRKNGLVFLALHLGSGDAGAPEGLEFLTRHFGEITDSNQRAEAIDRFRKSLHQPALELIGKALTDPSPEVRDGAREAIHAFRQHREALEEFQRWQTGDAESRESIFKLIALLGSPDADVAAGAAKALGALKAKSALPALVKALGRGEPAVKQAAEAAIAKIGE